VGGGGNIKFEIEREVFSSLFICTKTKILQEYKTLNFLLRSPHGNRQKSPCILGKKSQESKTQDVISSDIFSKDFRKFWLFSNVFISRFFPETFFPGTFIHRFSTHKPDSEQIFLVIIRILTSGGHWNLEVKYLLDNLRSKRGFRIES